MKTRNLLALAVKAVAISAQILDAETDKFINGLLQEYNSAGGLSVAVVQLQSDGKWLVETKGYGVSNVKGDPVDADTLFAIGSNSKLFNVLSTGLLVSNTSLSKRISWDTKLVDIIPGWQLMDPIATAETTITDAMGHRTGLPRHDIMYRKNDSPSSMLKRLKYLKPSAPFRSIYQYTSTMYTALGMIPSLLLPGTTFEDYVQSNIFDKLSMKSTTYRYSVANATGKLANGFGREGMNQSRDLFDKGIPRPMEYWNQADDSLIDGAGGIISSANDVAIFLQALLLGGSNPATGAPVIPPDVIQQALFGVSIVLPVAPYPEMSPVVYGGGQIQFSYRGQVIVEHDGGAPGFLSKISRLPNSNLGIAVLTNDDVFGDPLFDIVKFYLIDKILLPGQPPIDWKTRSKTKIQASYDLIQALVPPPSPSESKPPLVNFTTLAGVYNNPGYEDFELCYLPSNSSSFSSTQSRSCSTLVSTLPTALPDIFDRDRRRARPMYVIGSPQFWVSHIVLEHFDGNLFNVTMVESRKTINDPKQSYWVAPFGFAKPVQTAEFAFSDAKTGTLGMAWRGVWDSGSFAPAVKGHSVEQTAEVWFEKVTK